MHCNQCGLEVPDNYKFCPKCGAEITLESKSIESSKEKSNKKETHQPQKSKKKISTKKAIGIGIGVFFAFIIVLGQIAVYFSDNGKQPALSPNYNDTKIGDQIIDEVTVESQQQQIVSLQQLFPTRTDGIDWKLNAEKDLSYQGDNEYILGYEKEFIKVADFGSNGHIVVDIHKFNSYDEARKVNDGKIARAQEESSSTKYENINGWGFPSECYGMKESFGFQERIKLFCVKDNFRIYIGALGDLFDLEDQSVNFAKMILSKIG